MYRCSCTCVGPNSLTGTGPVTVMAQAPLAAVSLVMGSHLRNRRDSGSQHQSAVSGWNMPPGTASMRSRV